jgi:hypothetical protein
VHIVNQSEMRVKSSERVSAPIRQLAEPLCVAMIGFVLLSPIGTPAQAQTAGKTATAQPFHYDAGKEVTLSGKVAKVLAKAEPGMMAGAHLVLETPAGLVDASLGRFSFEGKGALTIVAGQPVEATGVMRTINSSQILVVRTVVLDGEAYVIRNEHGFAISPQARERGSGKTNRDGGAL